MGEGGNFWSVVIKNKFHCGRNGRTRGFSIFPTPPEMVGVDMAIEGKIADYIE